MKKTNKTKTRKDDEKKVVKMRLENYYYYS